MNLTIDGEIEQSLAAGVDHPENLPFLLTPENPNQYGILLVHGFGSTPREMRTLGDHLFRKNFTVLGIRLPGHGTSPEDLAIRRHEEWLDAADRGYQILKQMNLKVSAVGLSTGSLILLQLSLQRQLERLVLLSPFLRLKHPLAPLAGILRFVTPYHHRTIEPSNQPFYYQRRPLRGIAQLNRLRWGIKRKLSQITTPTLVIAAKGDQTNYPGSAEELFKRLGSKKKSFYCYGEDTPHALTIDENPHQADVFLRTCAFLEIALEHQQTRQQFLGNKAL